MTRIGPHGSAAFGWRTVQRTIAAGLIENRSANFHRSALYVPESTTQEG